MIKNSEIRNFWATQTLYTSKESWEQLSFRFEIKSGDFVIKNLKKNRFCDFLSQKIIISAQSRLNFWKTCQDSKKWLDYLVLGMFFDKVKKFCDHSMILWEMAGDLLSSGQNPPPPAVFRVNGTLCFLCFWEQSMLGRTFCKIKMCWGAKYESAKCAKEKSVLGSKMSISQCSLAVTFSKGEPRIWKTSLAQFVQNFFEIAFWRTAKFFQLGKFNGFEVWLCTGHLTCQISVKTVSDKFRYQEN